MKMLSEGRGRERRGCVKGGRAGMCSRGRGRAKREKKGKGVEVGGEVRLGKRSGEEGCDVMR